MVEKNKNLKKKYEKKNVPWEKTGKKVLGK